MRVTGLAGGVGGAKMLEGLSRVVDDLTAVVNTGDDAKIYGVHVSPDVDIVTYRLAGIADTEKGWGIKDDTFHAVEAFGLLGQENWFRLGDRDLGTCLVRTEKMEEGASLSAVTDGIRRALGVTVRILPMTDDPVATRLVTQDGQTLEFQEYFVKLKHEPAIAEVRLAGISEAKPAPGVLDALRGADAIVVCPSNPLISIGPILALPEVRESLREHDKVIAVSPIVGGKALKGPADALLRSTGSEASALGVARLYSDFVDLFVIDETDSDEVEAIRGSGIEAVALDTIMTDASAAERLAQALL